MKVTVIREEPKLPPVEKVIIELEPSLARQLTVYDYARQGTPLHTFLYNLKAALVAAEAL